MYLLQLKNDPARTRTGSNDHRTLPAILFDGNEVAVAADADRRGVVVALLPRKNIIAVAEGTVGKDIAVAVALALDQVAVAERTLSALVVVALLASVKGIAVAAEQHGGVVAVPVLLDQNAITIAQAGDERPVAGRGRRSEHEAERHNCDNAKELLLHWEISFCSR